MLISRYMKRKDCQKAEELLQAMPGQSPVDKKQLQAHLYIATGQLEEAVKLQEIKLISAISEV